MLKIKDSQNKIFGMVQKMKQGFGSKDKKKFEKSFSNMEEKKEKEENEEETPIEAFEGGSDEETEREEVKGNMLKPQSNRKKVKVALGMLKNTKSLIIEYIKLFENLQNANEIGIDPQNA